MLRFGIKLITIFFLAFAALNLTARTLGTVQPPNPALAGFSEDCEGKPQPCWYGIVPGKTGIDESKERLLKLGYGFVDSHPIDSVTTEEIFRNDAFPCILVEFTHRIASATMIDGLALDGCKTIYLGDVVQRLGEPRQFDYYQWSFGDGFITTPMTYHSTPNSNTCFNFMPEGQVMAIGIDYQNRFASGILAVHAVWHGFEPYRLYVRDYDFPSCRTMDLLP